jgi:hypothetical protein
LLDTYSVPHKQFIKFVYKHKPYTAIPVASVTESQQSGQSCICIYKASKFTLVLTPSWCKYNYETE